MKRKGHPKKQQGAGWLENLLAWEKREQKKKQKKGKKLQLTDIIGMGKQKIKAKIKAKRKQLGGKYTRHYTRQMEKDIICYNRGYRLK